MVELPRQDFGEWLLVAFRECLECDPIQPNNDFFELGGDSIDAMKLLARIRSELGRSVPLSTFLKSASVSKLVAVLENPELTTDGLSEEMLMQLLEMED